MFDETINFETKNEGRGVIRMQVAKGKISPLRTVEQDGVYFCVDDPQNDFMSYVDLNRADTIRLARFLIRSLGKMWLYGHE